MELFSVWLATFLTLAIFSFLYKDNPIYKFSEHLFIGVSAGYVLIQQWTGTLKPNLVDHLVKVGTEGAYGNLPRIGALILGFMVLARLIPKASWISRWPLAALMGTFAALRMTGYAQSDLVEQINGTMVPLVNDSLPWFSWEGPSFFNHLILIVGVFSVLIYFFFSIEQKGITKHVAYVGTFFLMVTFGSSFGYTVMARISLLIGRAQDLYSFAERKYGYASIICTLFVIGYLIVWEWRNRIKKENREE